MLENQLQGIRTKSEATNPAQNRKPQSRLKSGENNNDESDKDESDDDDDDDGAYDQEEYAGVTPGVGSS